MDRAALCYWARKKRLGPRVTSRKRGEGTRRFQMSPETQRAANGRTIARTTRKDGPGCVARGERTRTRGGITVRRRPTLGGCAGIRWKGEGGLPPHSLIRRRRKKRGGRSVALMRDPEFLSHPFCHNRQGGEKKRGGGEESLPAGERRLRSRKKAFFLCEEKGGWA